MPALAWLPAGILLVSLVRFGAMSRSEGLPFPIGPETLFMLPQMLLGLAVTAPCGLPLALACRRIWQTGSHAAAWMSFAILASLTAVASLFAGLLGPIAIAIYAAVLSVPAWITFAILRSRRRSS